MLFILAFKSCSGHRITDEIIYKNEPNSSIHTHKYKLHRLLDEKHNYHIRKNSL